MRNRFVSAALLMLLLLLISTAPSVHASSTPATAPSTQPAQGVCTIADCSFRYPGDWKPTKGATACFDVEAPPCPSQAYAELCLDVPHLPPHFAWMISAKRVESGYVDNLRKTTIPDAQVAELTPVPVAGCQQALRVKSTGHDPHGRPAADVAVIAIRSGGVYIFSCESNAPGERLARTALDTAIATLKWTK